MGKSKFGIDLCEFFVAETEEHIVVFDSQEIPLAIFPLAGRRWDFVRDYVFLMFQFFDTHVFMKCDCSGEFQEKYKKLSGYAKRQKVLERACEVVEGLENTTPCPNK